MTRRGPTPRRPASCAYSRSMRSRRGAAGESSRWCWGGSAGHSADDDAANNSCSLSRPLRRRRPRDSNASPAAPSAKSRVVPDTHLTRAPCQDARAAVDRQTLDTFAGQRHLAAVNADADGDPDSRRYSTSSSPLRMARSAPSNTMKRIPCGLDLAGRRSGPARCGRRPRASPRCASRPRRPSFARGPWSRRYR